MRHFLILVLSFLLTSTSWAQGFISQQIANQISRTTSSAITQNLAANLLIPKLKIYRASGRVLAMSLSADERLLSVLHDDGSLRLWDMQRGVQRPAIRASGTKFTVAVPLSLSYRVLAGQDNGQIAIYDGMTGRALTALRGPAAVTALRVTRDETTALVAYHNGEIVVWDLRNNTSQQRWQANGVKHLTLTTDDHTLLVARDEGKVEKWDWRRAIKLAELPTQEEEITALWHARDSARWAALDEDGLWQMFDGEPAQRRAKKALEEGAAVALTPAFDRMAWVENDQRLQILQLPAATPSGFITTQEPILALQFIDHGRRLLGADANGVLHVWDVASTRETLKLISTETGWTVVDDAGRFDSSEAGMPNVAWEAGEQELPIDNFSQQHYEPGLLASHLQNDRFINRQPPIVPQGITLPPQVTVQLPASRNSGQVLEVTVEVIDQGGGITDIRLYHNGKIVPSDAMREIGVGKVDERVKKTVAFTVTPIAGRNEFKALAANTMGIDSLAHGVHADFSGPPSQPSLHVMTVGINRYQDSSMNLDYSVADAQAIAALLNNQQKLPVSRVTHHGLYDENATKNAIVQQLQSLTQAPQEDLLALYLAGHGVAIQGEWYFLPHETVVKDDESYYTRVGLSASEIRQFLAKMKMQRILIMVDACYSGAGVQVFRKMQDTQRHFSRSLSKTVGIVMLAATRQDQEAAELSDLGHGLFTYVVQKGLRGDADTNPRDTQVSAHEVVGFSSLEIPAFSSKYLQAAQEPTAFTMGSDFALLKTF